MPTSRYIAILLHNDLVLPEGERTSSIVPSVETKFTKISVSCTIESSLWAAGKRRSKQLGVDFSIFVEALIRKDLCAANHPLCILLRD
jgi:hypothetical protein